MSGRRISPGELGRAVSTIRGYQCTLRLFCDYLTDPRYGWVEECETRFGTHPVQVCHEWNTLAHLVEYEGGPGRRPLTREELQRFFDHADAQVGRAVRARRKGALAAYRDATLFKVMYAWGLRRTERSRLDVTDFYRNPHAPELLAGTRRARRARRLSDERSFGQFCLPGWLPVCACGVGGDDLHWRSRLRLTVLRWAPR